jgi:hypothetical protein
MELAVQNALGKCHDNLVVAEDITGSFVLDLFQMTHQEGDYTKNKYYFHANRPVC